MTDRPTFVHIRTEEWDELHRELEQMRTLLDGPGMENLRDCAERAEQRIAELAAELNARTEQRDELKRRLEHADFTRENLERELNARTEQRDAVTLLNNALRERNRAMRHDIDDLAAKWGAA